MFFLLLTLLLLPCSAAFAMDQDQPNRIARELFPVPEHVWQERRDRNAANLDTMEVMIRNRPALPASQLSEEGRQAVDAWWAHWRQQAAANAGRNNQ